ncbi:hypothetical protein STANM309S_03199 [Streptomyces tanashiensis]
MPSSSASCSPRPRGCSPRPPGSPSSGAGCGRSSAPSAYACGTRGRPTRSPARSSSSPTTSPGPGYPPLVAAVLPGRMVAKTEVRRWPVLGTLAALGGTLFIDRDRLRALPATVRAMSGCSPTGAGWWSSPRDRPGAGGRGGASGPPPSRPLWTVDPPCFRYGSTTGRPEPPRTSGTIRSARRCGGWSRRGAWWPVFRYRIRYPASSIRTAVPWPPQPSGPSPARPSPARPSPSRPSPSRPFSAPTAPQPTVAKDSANLSSLSVHQRVSSRPTAASSFRTPA